jgi:alpha-1,2-mannosyltransferase
MPKALIENLRGFAADLTRKRVRGHAALLGLVLWGAYAINIATPGLKDREGQLKGADFLHFYVLGNIARLHDASMLYDAPRQAALARKLIQQNPPEVYLPVYGPQVSMLFAPYAMLSYGLSTFAWMATCALIYGLCCMAILKVCPRLKDERASVLLLSAVFPGFFFVLASGQNSALALLAFTAAFFFFRTQRFLLAGMAIGVLVYKPQFGVMAAILFLITLEWKVVFGAVIAGTAELSVAGWYYGRPALETWFRELANAEQKASAPLYRMHGLRTFWQMLFPWHGVANVLYAVTALAVVAITVWCWKSKGCFELRYAVFLLGTALVDPHLADYDLVVLMPAFLLIGDRILLGPKSTERDIARVLTYVAYCLPLFGPMLKVVHVQLSVPAYVGLFLVVAAVLRQHLHGSAMAQPEAASPLIA